MFPAGVIPPALMIVKNATAASVPSGISRRIIKVGGSFPVQAILAAIGCQQVYEIKSIIEQQGRAVFGTMDGEKLQPLFDLVPKGKGIPLYFYETG